LLKFQKGMERQDRESHHDSFSRKCFTLRHEDTKKPTLFDGSMAVTTPVARHLISGLPILSGSSLRVFVVILSVAVERND
jgi:hypothetical protein